MAFSQVVMSMWKRHGRSAIICNMMKVIIRIFWLRISWGWYEGWHLKSQIACLEFYMWYKSYHLTGISSLCRTDWSVNGYSHIIGNSDLFNGCVTHHNHSYYVFSTTCVSITICSCRHSPAKVAASKRSSSNVCRPNLSLSQHWGLWISVSNGKLLWSLLCFVSSVMAV